MLIHSSGGAGTAICTLTWIKAFLQISYDFSIIEWHLMGLNILSASGLNANLVFLKLAFDPVALERDDI